MNADDFPNLQARKADAYPCKEETHGIIGCAFEVLNELGHGLNEKLYENALVIEFKRRSIAFDQQRTSEVLYKGEHVGEFRPARRRLLADRGRSRAARHASHQARPASPGAGARSGNGAGFKYGTSVGIKVPAGAAGPPHDCSVTTAICYRRRISGGCDCR